MFLSFTATTLILQKPSVTTRHQPTDEVVSTSAQLHHALQVVVPEDLPAARVQAAVRHFGHFLS